MAAQTRRLRKRRLRPMTEILETRALLSMGGGYVGGGLKGEYFTNRSLAGVPALTRVDAQVNFDWGYSAPGAGVGADNFSARWTGRLVADFTETYRFSTTSDDGVRLLIRPTGSPSWTTVINAWTDHAAAAWCVGPIHIL